MAGVPQHPARCTARDAGVRMRRVNKRRVNRRRNGDRESGILKCVSARALSSGIGTRRSPFSHGGETEERNRAARQQ